MLFFRLKVHPEAAIELEAKLKYDTAVIRHLLLKVDTPSLEDSFLLLETKEAKKTSQVEEEIQDKLQLNSEKKTDTISDEDSASEESKDGDE